MKRTVAPEILDSLDSSDPRALRSRQDLRLINTFMAGESWILRELSKLQPSKVVELGAGEGTLVNKIKAQFNTAQVIGVDLVPEPSSVHAEVEWHQGDVLEYQGFGDDTVVVANLFIHHLDAAQLNQLGKALSGAGTLLFAEPLRAHVPKMMGRCLFPFINDVTRHDMIVSIEAGFQEGELAELMPSFSWKESQGIFGGLRMKGVPH